jgi:hypothetical protein
LKTGLNGAGANKSACDEDDELIGDEVRICAEFVSLSDEDEDVDDEIESESLFLSMLRPPVDTGCSLKSGWLIELLMFLKAII